jgi:diamine N-acetyltransferase
MMQVLIKQMMPDEVDLLEQISRKTFFETFTGTTSAENLQKYLDDNFTSSRFLNELNTAGSAFYLAWSGKKLIGYMKINKGEAQNEFRYDDSMEIERLYLIKEFWGKAAGQKLLDFAFQQALAMNARMIWLGVWENNLRAIRFYKKNDFQVIGKHPFAVGEDVQTDLLMRKVIG